VRVRTKVLPLPPRHAFFTMYAIASDDGGIYVVEGKKMQVAFRFSRRTKKQRMSARHRWQSFTKRAGMLRRTWGPVWVCAAIGRRQREWLTIGGAIESASARRRVQTPRRVSIAARGQRAKRDTRGPDARRSSLVPVRLEPAQRRTLEVGSCFVLSGLGLGFQLGSWPAWSIVAAAGFYVGWVVLYAEITVQAKRRPALWQRWQWRRPLRPRGRATLQMASASAPQPAQEQSPT